MKGYAIVFLEMTVAYCLRWEGSFFLHGIIFYSSLFVMIGILSVTYPLTIIFLFLLLLFLLWQKKFTFPLLCVLLFIFIIFSFRTYLDIQETTKLNEEVKHFTFTFLHSMKVDGDSFSAYGKEVLTKEKLIIRYKIPTVEWKGKLQSIQPGYVCKMTGKLEVPKQNRNRYAFQYQEYLKREKIYWILQAEHIDLESCVKKDTFYTMIQRLRQRGIFYLQQTFPEHISSLAIALIFGERFFLGEDLLSAYERLGIVHLLAISGLHVGLLVAMLFYGGIRLQFTREKVSTMLLFFLPIYILLTGASPSVLRAGLMVFIVLLSEKIKIRSLTTIDVLSMVFLILLFIKPLLLYHVGFQLSFSVTVALLLSNHLIKKYRHQPVQLLFVVSLISQIVSLPFIVYHFYEFSLVALIVNIFYVPLYSVLLLPLLLILFLLSFVIPLSSVLNIIDFYIREMNQLTKFLSTFPFSTIILGRPPFIFFVIYSVATCYFFYHWDVGAKVKKLFITFLPLFLICFFQFHSGIFQFKGEVTMIDVGQGDSILIKLPFNKGTYLIDTGGNLSFPKEEWQEKEKNFEVGEDILVPYLKSRGIRSLDKLILTHGDLDHVGGAFAVIKELKVKEVLFPRVQKISNLDRELIQLCVEKEISYKFVKAGDGWQVDDVYFYILSPLERGQLEKNNQSIVILSNMGGLNWLFTGDLEEKGEQLLLARYPNLTVDILKIGHHGSKTSTTDLFLDRIKAKVALISCGENNPFGHPHQEVLKRLEERGIVTYRTDKNGEIFIQFRKKNGTFFVDIHTIQ